ncbi:MAG: hypothetical protein JWQ35_1120, partial [Bacteriovoracaceae bacterium]|nr:hypothetical protein [Bacteriovoracaceae bacterium]
MLKPLKIFLVFSLISFTQSLFSKDAPPEHFRVPKSTLDALERKLKEETDPSKRVQLLLRWVKNKEDYEQSLLEKKLGVEKASEQKNGDQLALFKGFKVDIVTRLQTEIADLAKHPKLNLDPLYHVLGFRLLELQKYPEAVMAFQKISGKTSEDFMGLGDAYFAAKNTRAALDAFEHGGLDSKYRNTAGYKRAWCFLQLSDFQNALAEFDIALEDNPYNTIKLKEEVFRDRLRPYVETYQKLIFDDEELLNLKKLASRVHPEALEKSKELLAAGLKALILNFNAKAQIEKAQAVFGYLTKEIKDPLSVLVLAAPIWIKVYRGQLNHEAVEKITDSLPSKKIEGFDTTLLETELYNSVVFYDTLFKEDNLPTTRKLLFKINKKFFQLFPGNQQADPLRVGYAKLLLEDGDPAECIQILSARKRGDKEVEDLALSLDA